MHRTLTSKYLQHCILNLLTSKVLWSYACMPAGVEDLDSHENEVQQDFNLLYITM